jgi:hypothetical protein
MGDYGDDLPTETVPESTSASNIHGIRKRMELMAQDWRGPKYKVSFKARREMELERSSTNRNAPRMVELSKFPSHSLPAPLPSGLRNCSIVVTVLNAQPDLSKKIKFSRKLKNILTSQTCEDILKNVFWWFYIDIFKEGQFQEEKHKLYQNASAAFARLIMMAEIKVLGESKATKSKDTFTLRYPSLLAQLVYSVFCWAYPQSHPKFDSDFRETILQTCSRWVGGIRLQPELHKKWDLQKLEPLGFRLTTHKPSGRDPTENDLDGTRKSRRATPIKFGNSETQIKLKNSVEKLRRINRIGGGRRGTVLSQIPQKTKKEDSSRVYEFKKTKFNIAGLSPFLENYLVRPDQTENQTGAVCSWQPIVDRTEIVGELNKKSLHQILIESRAKAKRTKKMAESVMKEEEINLKRFQNEMKKNHEELDQQINTIMKSKTQIHQFCEMIMTNTKLNNPLATDKLIKILKKSLEK